jgi:hypothetical protein
VYKVYITKKMTTKNINFGNNNESGSLEISRALVMNLSINNENKELNNHRLKAGGLVLRTESPDTGQKTRLGLRSKIVIYFGLKMVLEIVFDHLFGQFSRSHTKKYPLAQKCLPQYFFRKSGKLSNSFVELLPLIRRMISLGAILGGADTNR